MVGGRNKNKRGETADLIKINDFLIRNTCKICKNACHMQKCMSEKKI